VDFLDLGIKKSHTPGRGVGESVGMEHLDKVPGEGEEGLSYQFKLRVRTSKYQKGQESKNH